LFFSCLLTLLKKKKMKLRKTIKSSFYKRVSQDTAPRPRLFRLARFGHP
jgi:hypothetical protein